MPTKQVEIASFSERLKELMREKAPDYWIQNLADDLQLSFEHARKLVKGLAIPTDLRCEAIARVFDVDPAELIEIAEAEKFHKKYGKTALAPNFNPELAAFSSAWGLLTDTQKSSLLGSLKRMVSENVSRAGA
jgi:transcriptional regulator with XRE-family HTH domain